MDTKSRLLTLDIWLESELKEGYLVALERHIFKEFTVLKVTKHEFEPVGLTKVFILSESHCVIHTYPENNFLSFDLFICNEKIDLEDVAIKILKIFPVFEHQINILNRGIPLEKCKSSPYVVNI